MKKRIQTILWLAFYLLMVFLPLILLMIFPRPPGREFLREFSVALGFLAMALLGLQTIPTSRLKFFASVFPMDTLYKIHHNLSIFTLIITVIHPILIFINNPKTLALLNIFLAPWRAKAAVTSLVVLLALVATSVWREAMKIKYDVWRWVHDALSFIAIGLAIFHMFKVNYYMSLTYQKVIWLTLTGLWLLIILYIRVIRPIGMLKRPYKVVRVVEERGQCWSLYLEPDGHEGFEYTAGQFAWITTESPFIFRENPFSFTTDSNDEGKSFGFTIKELGDFTSTIKNLQPGQTIYVDGPYGNFNMDDHKDKEMVFIAGGIGSAPVMSMLRTMAVRDSQKEMVFFYGNPTWDTVIFREELEALEEKLNLKVVNILEMPHGGWNGESGFITTEVMRRHLTKDYKDAVYFICGPLPMIKALQKCFKDLEIPPKYVYVEQYEMA